MDSLLAAGFISLLSLTGVFFFGKTGRIVGTHRFIVPFAIGAFISVAFFELIPETLAAMEIYGSVSIVVGFLSFYLLSNLLHTYHHHHDDHKHSDHCAADKVSALMLLWGDAIHNVTDGVVIASAFIINPTVGLITTFGIALHEIPQEVAEYGVLLKAGYSPKKALFLNFLSALGVILGVVLSLIFISYFNSYIWILTGLAAGNLLYVATSDLLPGVHQESYKSGSFVPSFVATLLGITLVAGLIIFTHSLV